MSIITDVKTDISLSKALLEQVETLAQEMQISRNHVFALAVQDFITRRRQNQQLLEQINQAYEDGPDEEERAWLEQARQHHRRLVESEW